ncbi:MAG: hypothetical protein KGK07_06320 [Chloroflexota bacterium]|nr:hypothetical protein [Chloroflexota bacterium]
MPTVIRDWRAAQLLAFAAAAERAAVIETLDAAVADAKASHGWQSRTGAALLSIRREDPRPSAAGRGVLGAFGFEPIPLVGNTHRERSRKTGRLRQPRTWDMHGLFLEIGFRGRPGDHTIRRAADREFPTLPERIRAHLPAELRA